MSSDPRSEAEIGPVRNRGRGGIALPADPRARCTGTGPETAAV